MIFMTRERKARAGTAIANDKLIDIEHFDHG